MRLRDQILDAAAHILRESGVKMLAQSRVARAAGIPQGHLTYYFPRRADLLVAVARRSIEQAAIELESFFGSDGWHSAGDDLCRRALAIVGFLVKDCQRTRLLLGLLVEAEDDAALRTMLLGSVARARELLARGLGLAPEDPDVDLVMATLWGLGIQHLLLGQDRPSATDRLIARLPAWLGRAATSPGRKRTR